MPKIWIELNIESSVPSRFVTLAPKRDYPPRRKGIAESQGEENSSILHYATAIARVDEAGQEKLRVHAARLNQGPGLSRRPSYGMIRLSVTNFFPEPMTTAGQLPFLSPGLLARSAVGA